MIMKKRHARAPRFWLIVTSVVSDGYSMIWLVLKNIYIVKYFSHKLGPHGEVVSYLLRVIPWTSSALKMWVVTGSNPVVGQFFAYLPIYPPFFWCLFARRGYTFVDGLVVVSFVPISDSHFQNGWLSWWNIRVQSESEPDSYSSLDNI